MSSNCLQRRPLLCNESYAGLSKGKPDKASKETEFVDSPGRGNMALVGDLVMYYEPSQIFGGDSAMLGGFVSLAKCTAITTRLRLSCVEAESAVAAEANEFEWRGPSQRHL